MARVLRRLHVPPVQPVPAEAWAVRVPKLDRVQLEARIARARERGDLEPLSPAPKVFSVEELRLRKLLWDLEDLLAVAVAVSP